MVGNFTRHVMWLVGFKWLSVDQTTDCSHPCSEIRIRSKCIIQQFGWESMHTEVIEGRLITRKVVVDLGDTAWQTHFFQVGQHAYKQELFTLFGCNSTVPVGWKTIEARLDMLVGVPHMKRYALVCIPIANDDKLLHCRTPIASKDIVVQILATVWHEEHRVTNDSSPCMFILLNNFQLELFSDGSITLVCVTAISIAHRYIW